jgi:hypothetical protein
VKFRRREGLVTKSPIVKRSMKINGRNTIVSLEDANMVMSGGPGIRETVGLPRAAIHPAGAATPAPSTAYRSFNIFCG